MAESSARLEAVMAQSVISVPPATPIAKIRSSQRNLNETKVFKTIFGIMTPHLSRVI